MWMISDETMGQHKGSQICSEVALCTIFLEDEPHIKNIFLSFVLF